MLFLNLKISNKKTQSLNPNVRICLKILLMTINGHFPYLLAMVVQQLGDTDVADYLLMCDGF